MKRNIIIAAMAVFFVANLFPVGSVQADEPTITTVEEVSGGEYLITLPGGKVIKSSLTDFTVEEHSGGEYLITLPGGKVIKVSG
jgi:hypothetical protein